MHRCRSMKPHTYAVFDDVPSVLLTDGAPEYDLRRQRRDGYFLAVFFVAA